MVSENAPKCPSLRTAESEPHMKIQVEIEERIPHECPPYAPQKYPRHCKRSFLHIDAAGIITQQYFHTILPCYNRFHEGSHRRELEEKAGSGKPIWASLNK